MAHIKKFVLFVCCCLSWSANGSDCGSLENAYGPFDYRNQESRQNNLPLVERAHFNEVTYTSALLGLTNKEYTKRYNLTRKKIKMKGTGLPIDIDYTLRAFPNHHRALYAMMEYQRHTGSPTRSGYRTAECYLVRARQFAPDDEVVLLLYGMYYHKNDEYENALEKYKAAERLNPNSPEIMYNMGLLYYDLNNFEKAKMYAEKAYVKGHPLPGLKNKLLKHRPE